MKYIISGNDIHITEVGKSVRRSANAQARRKNAHGRFAPYDGNDKPKQEAKGKPKKPGWIRFLVLAKPCN